MTSKNKKIFKNIFVGGGGGYICSCCREKINTKPILVFKHISTESNAYFHSFHDAISAKYSSLSIIQCPKCGFVWNVVFEPNEIIYHNYTFSLNHSIKYQKHVKWLINKVTNEYKISNTKILEIGCGDANFLYQLSKATNSMGIGYEPSFENRIELFRQIKEEYEDFQNYVKIIPDFFKEDNIEEDFRLVVCRHVLEHIPNPSEFISSLYLNLKNHKNVLLLFEVPNLDYILSSKCLTHFIYEHCNYFSRSSLQELFQNNGFNILEISSCYSGAFQTIIATNAILSESKINKYQSIKIKRNFFKNILSRKMRKIKTKIDKNSKIAIWGASNGGNIVYNITKNLTNILCFIDSNTEKHGGFMANCGLPIVSFEDAIKMNVNTIIISNPIYNAEIKKIISKKQCGIKIILF